MVSMGNYVKIILAVITLAAVAYGVLVFDIGRKREITDFITCAAAGYPIMESYPRQCRDPKTGLIYAEIIEKPLASEMIVVDSPIASTSVSSPLVATGQARGNWFFEASFPVRVIGADGVELGVGIAQSQGDWMTTEFVPFIANVQFDPKGNTEGVIRFSKDNPSGLPEFDAHVDVPVTFELQE